MWSGPGVPQPFGGVGAAVGTEIVEERKGWRASCVSFNRYSWSINCVSKMFGKGLMFQMGKLRPSGEGTHLGVDLGLEPGSS